MAKRSRMSMQKRQREIKKAEKAAQKRAKRHGFVLERPPEPVPTLGADALFGPNQPDSHDEVEESTETSPDEEKGETEEKGEEPA